MQSRRMLGVVGRRALRSVRARTLDDRGDVGDQEALPPAVMDGFTDELGNPLTDELGVRLVHG